MNSDERGDWGAQVARLARDGVGLWITGEDEDAACLPCNECDALLIDPTGEYRHMGWPGMWFHQIQAHGRSVADAADELAMIEAGAGVADLGIRLANLAMLGDAAPFDQLVALYVDDARQSQIDSGYGYPEEWDLP